MTSGFVWTVGQAGLDSADKNLCDLATRIWQAPIENCDVVIVLTRVWEIGAFLVAMFIFWDFIYWFRTRKRSFDPRKKWKSVPITEQNLAAYIHGSSLVQTLDEQIAQIEKLPINRDSTVGISEQENTKFFGVYDIAELNKLLENNQDAVVRMSSYGHSGGDHIRRGESIMHLFEVLGAQLGEKSFRDLNRLRRYSRITDNGIKIRLDAYLEFSKNHKVKVQVPLVPDFNLIPIEEGLALVRKRCARSTFAKSLPKQGSTKTELLAYLERLKNQIVFYGKLRGRNERAPLGVNPLSDEFPPPGFPLSSAVLNPRFESGNIVIDSQVFHNDRNGVLTATNVIYDRLYVLRPDLNNTIEQLNKAKICRPW